MPKSIIVYGPQGCGKTTNAEKMRKAFNLKKIVDGWEPGESFEERNVLYLTNAELDEVNRRRPEFPDVVPFSLARAGCKKW